jgi:hypothetical protein
VTSVSAAAGVFILLWGAVSPLSADSVFGTRAFGVPVVQLDGRSWSMGGVSAALGGENFSTTNPATIANFYRSGLTGLIIPEYRRTRDASGEANMRSFPVPAAKVVVPLRRKFVAGGGVKQEFDLNWRFDFEREFEGSTLAEHLGNQGSLYSLYLSVARPIVRQVSVGLDIEFHRGGADRSWFLQAPPEVEGLPRNLNTQDIVENDYSGESLTVGVLASPARWIDVGLSFRPGYSLSIDRTLTAGTGHREKSSGSLDVPSCFILGCAVMPVKKLQAGFEYERSPWGDRSPGEFLPFRTADYERVSLGLEYLPSVDPLSAAWLRWPLRAGFMWRGLPSLVDGYRVTETSWTAGIGIWLGNGRGRLDLFTDYTTRGSMDETGVEERLLRFGVSISGFEKWVPKRKGRPI